MRQKRHKGVNAVKTGVFHFYKDHVGWFIDLPAYTGPRGDLMMVCGADVLLDKLSNRSKNVHMKLSTEEFEGAYKLELVNLCTREGENGADYVTNAFLPPKVKKKSEVWLCPVTELVFGEYPKQIYFSAV